MQKLLLAHGGGGDDILKKCFGFLYILMQNWLLHPKFYIFKAFNIENGFHSQKYSGQGSFKVKKGTIDKLLFLLKTIGIYP